MTILYINTDLVRKYKNKFKAKANYEVEEKIEAWLQKQLAKKK